MKLPLAVTAGLPQVSPKGRAFQVTHLSHVVGPDVAVRVRGHKFQLLSNAIAEAEKVDPRLNPQIILVEAE